MLLPGSVCGYVTPAMASELGIPSNTPVATSLIDAHAGALALMGAVENGELTGRLGKAVFTSFPSG